MFRLDGCGGVGQNQGCLHREEEEISARIVAFVLLFGALAVACSGSTGSGGLEDVLFEYEVTRVLPHDESAWTQGLAWRDSLLYEGTGRYGESTLRRVRPADGAILDSHALDGSYFGEGIALVGDLVYQLTWRNRRCFVYELDGFAPVDTFDFGGEGWGLTYDGERLIMSNGGSKLFFRDPETFEIIGSVEVRSQGTRVHYLNELEWAAGDVYANVLYSDRIARIDPVSGEVRGWIDLSEIVAQLRRGGRADVLNGIAYHEDSGRLLVTGKLWPSVFEIELVETP